ncbi:HAD-IA family hydrolase [Glycomyces scopariae]|uniref:Haloacid dehalogenase superfamily, subfamily IA, variant 3 with third motif having DD or ED/haloacid dehalogenase superfamily, subfamily IA, variant 1 with third motif having Dx(3-4)D or Dx(3-4)E n=1 Tax=Glycomyces sambucus TaxID=380244 RepID=A0A1G9F4J0_9ACTN|nr:HAD-IA family hydrolase [Glycomyces sambucus]SDK83306.1 haloacid dehalogenase superfamily, subfamily IA, variant 3 with third motif having DD or ED/haloacid dehalogenase superfamily, subfamily IA, variant 1 with third motif having Dx(3-4)D or Dx(3-4)E [Glycomyces sambucus]
MIYNLFDSAAAYRPTEAEQAGPVPPIEAVLFDFSNTIFKLVDVPTWLGRIAAATGRALDAEVLEKTAEQLYEAYRIPEVAAAQIGRDESAARHRTALLTWFARIDYLQGIEDAAYESIAAPDAWVPYPDTEPLLRELRRRGIRTGIVSDFPWDVGVHMAHFGLDDLVDVRVVSYQYGTEKPDPVLFRAACERLGVDPRATLMVGDNPAKDGGAAASGLRAYILPGEPRTGERGLAHVLGFLD